MSPVVARSELGHGRPTDRPLDRSSAAHESSHNRWLLHISLARRRRRNYAADTLASVDDIIPLPSPPRPVRTSPAPVLYDRRANNQLDPSSRLDRIPACPYDHCSLQYYMTAVLHAVKLRRRNCRQMTSPSKYCLSLFKRNYGPSWDWTILCRIIPRDNST